MKPKEARAQAWIALVSVWMAICSLTAQDLSLRIVTQPRLEGTFGRDAYLRVVAEGSPPISYRWFKDGGEMVGQSGDVLLFSPLTAADAGTYSVKVANLTGALMSNPVEIPRPPEVRLRARELFGPGDSILRLIGDHLDLVDMVLLNGVSAMFKTLSDTELTVWIPNGQVNGPIQFRADNIWLSAAPEFDLQLPGGLLLALPNPPSGSLYPVFTNAAAALPDATWVLDNEGTLWSRSSTELGAYSHLQLKQSLAEKKWLGIASDARLPQDRWLMLSTEGVLYDRVGNTSRVERPIVSFGVTLNRAVALDQAGDVWTFPLLDNKLSQPLRVTGFGSNRTGLKAITKVFGGEDYVFALNRAGQVFRWAINSPTAQLMTFNHIGQAAEEDLIDWVPDASETGCGIRADGTVYLSRTVSVALDKQGLDLERIEGGIQQLLPDSQGRIGFLARSGLACLPGYSAYAANADGDFAGSVFRVTERHALARPRPYLGRSPLPLLASRSSTNAAVAMPSGHGPFRIQWVKNGLPVEGETNAALSQIHRDALVGNLGTVDRYTVRVSNQFGTTESEPLAVIARNPIVQAITPTQGPPGTMVTVKGSGLKHLTSLTVGEFAASFRVVDDSEAQLRVPNGVSDGIVRASAYSYHSLSTVRFKVTSGANAAIAWGEPHPELPYSAEYIPTNRTDSVAAYAGWRMSALRTAQPTLEVWGQELGHHFLRDSTAIASLRSRSVYAYIQNGQAKMLPNANGLPIPGFHPPELTGVIALAGSADVFFALRQDNFVMTWPPTDWGNPPFSPNSTSPFEAIAITAGAEFAAALGRDGTVRTWGKLGAAPYIPPNLPCIIGISASRLTLLALDIHGHVWELTRVNTENSLAKPQKPLPWMIDDCVDVESGDSGGIAQLRDGRRVQWDLASRKPPFHIEPVEPTAVFAIGSSHALGLFQNSIEVRRLPQGWLSVLEGAPMYVHPDILGAPPFRFGWTRQVNVTTELVTTNADLDLAHFHESDTGYYTFVIEDRYGVRFSQSLNLISVPAPIIEVLDPTANSPRRLRIRSVLVEQFPFNQLENSRWRVESAPDVEGPWSKMQFVRDVTDGLTVLYTPKASESPNQFFRVIYDPAGL